MTATITEPTTTTAFMATTSRDALESATKFIAAGLPTRPPVPGLSGLLLEATEAGITVSGFDWELATRQRIAGFGEGRVLVSGKLLKEMVAKLAKGNEVTLVASGTHLEVRCGSRTYTLPLLSIEDYPTLPEQAAAVAVIDADDLAKLAKVTVAASRNDTIPMLTAVRFDFDAAAGTVTAAATDRYRLGMLTLTAATELTGSAQVSATDVDFAIKHLAKHGDVTIGLTTIKGDGRYATDISHVSFTAGDREITVRTIGGEFPRYRALLPDPHNYAATLKIGAKALLTGIDGASVTLPRNCAVRLELDVTGATVQAGRTGDAQSSEFVGGTYEGEPMSTAYNPAYLVDGIKAIGSDTVQFNLVAASKPVVLTDAAGPDGAYLYLLMPVRLS